MKSATYPEYGHANCPKCGADVDLDGFLWGITAPPTAKSNEKLYFFLCHACGENHFSLDEPEQTDEAKEILENVISTWNTGNNGMLAVTTKTALIANNWNLSDAIEYGVPLPRELHDKIYSGDIDPHDIAPLLRQLAMNRDSSEAEL